MSKFKVGDRVKNVKPVASTKKTGIFGTVVSAGHSYDSIGVHFDENVGGHNCGLYSYSCKDGYGWYCKEEVIELVDKNIQSIHITVNGTTTVAVLKYGKNIVKRAEAKLSPNDTFNFETGAEIAFNRLFGVEPFKPCDSDSECKNESNLYLCIKDERPGEWLTKGKVYEFDNGFTYDDGFKSLSKYTNFDEYKEDNPNFASCLQPMNKKKKSAPQVKEVKRKAKVGEWVKIVDDANKDAGILKGEILQVGELWGECGVKVILDGDLGGIFHSRYAVLENYAPQQEQPKTYTQDELDEAVKAERERVYAEVKKIFEKGK